MQAEARLLLPPGVVVLAGRSSYDSRDGGYGAPPSRDAYNGGGSRYGASRDYPPASRDAPGSSYGGTGYGTASSTRGYDAG